MKKSMEAEEMFSYTAYGLGIRSALPLPELLAGGAPPEVVVRPGRVSPRPPVVEDRGCALWASPEEARFFYEGIGSALVREGREIVVEAAPGADEGEVRLLILGPALAWLLHQRGHLVLHASTVAVDGGAAGILGRTGQGKSTLAAALYRRAHGIVADDVTAVRLGVGPPTVYPSYPRLKLWPEAAEAMGDEPDSLPTLRPRLDKRNRPTDRGFPSGPLPLRRIYVLAEGPRHRIEPLRPQEAVMALVRNTYPVVANLLQASGTATAHFRQCVELVGRVPVASLNRPLCLESLPELARLVEEDLA